MHAGFLPGKAQAVVKGKCLDVVDVACQEAEKNLFKAASPDAVQEGVRLHDTETQFFRQEM